MTGMNPHVPTREIEKLLRESEQLRAESANLRPHSRRLARWLEQIIAENHLSERIRHALGD